MKDILGLVAYSIRLQLLGHVRNRSAAGNWRNFRAIADTGSSKVVVLTCAELQTLQEPWISEYHIYSCISVQ